MAANPFQMAEGPRPPQHLPGHPGSHIKRLIGVVSAKGGVGKSMLASLSAIGLARAGKKVGILDADVTGPSIPMAFGIHEGAKQVDGALLPARTGSEIQLMSVNLLLQEASDPVLWRGPILSGVIQQFWQEVAWGDLDHLLIDMPPGTSDVALTVFQQLPLDGILVVTSPQDLVSMIVKKALRMAEAMEVPVIGVIENFSYFRCPDNGKAYEVFGKSRAEAFCEEAKVPLLAKLPIRPELARLADEGRLEEAELEEMDPVVQALLAMPTEGEG